jgi:hypothetical protein
MLAKSIDYFTEGEELKEKGPIYRESFYAMFDIVRRQLSILASR